MYNNEVDGCLSSKGNDTNKSREPINEVTLTNIDDTGVTIIPEELVEYFKDAMDKHAPDDIIQIVNIKPREFSVTLCLLEKSMVEPAVDALNKYKIEKTDDEEVNAPLIDYVWISTNTRTQHSVRTEKIHEDDLKKFIKDGKVNNELVHNTLRRDNKAWFGKTGNLLVAVESWKSTVAIGHYVLLLYVREDAYNNFLRTPPCNTKVLIGTKSHQVYEDVHPTLCFQCLEYGHHAFKCEETHGTTITRCKKCAGNHKFNNCKSNTRKCYICATNNEMIDGAHGNPRYPTWTVEDTNHSPFADSCRAHKIEKNLLRIKLKAEARKNYQ